MLLFMAIMLNDFDIMLYVHANIYIFLNSFGAKYVTQVTTSVLHMQGPRFNPWQQQQQQQRV